MGEHRPSLGVRTVAINALGDVVTVVSCLVVIDGSGGSCLELGEIDGVNA